MELKRLVNKQIASDVNRLLEQEEFQRFYFWLLEQTQVFAMPDIRVDGSQLAFREGQRSIGMGLVALCESYRSIDVCRSVYEKQVEEAGRVLRGEGGDSDG